jgi:uncharacterized protein
VTSDERGVARGARRPLDRHHSTTTAEEHDMSETTVVRNDELSRYDVIVDDQVVGHMDFRLVGDRQEFVHTEIDRAYRGRDLAAQLVRGALDDARDNGMQVVPRCPYVASFIREHPEYADLVAP